MGVTRLCVTAEGQDLCENEKFKLLSLRRIWNLWIVVGNHAKGKRSKVWRKICSKNVAHLDVKSYWQKKLVLILQNREKHQDF